MNKRYHGQAYRHAKHRAWQRYGVNIDWDDFVFLCIQIQKGGAVRITDAKRRGEVWKVWIRGVELYAMYKRGCIRTFLPIDDDKVLLDEKFWYEE